MAPTTQTTNAATTTPIIAPIPIPSPPEGEHASKSRSIDFAVKDVFEFAHNFDFSAVSKVTFWKSPETQGVPEKLKIGIDEGKFWPLLRTTVSEVFTMFTHDLSVIEEFARVNTLSERERESTRKLNGSLMFLYL